MKFIQTLNKKFFLIICRNFQIILRTQIQVWIFNLQSASIKFLDCHKCPTNWEWSDCHNASIWKTVYLSTMSESLKTKWLTMKRILRHTCYIFAVGVNINSRNRN